ncbi:MAG: hypothetical protein F6K10_37795 [Moorea sp. SIO2B7]|nr:hypothetical protein [Moorena sp. SIO2B7]
MQQATGKKDCVPHYYEKSYKQETKGQRRTTKSPWPFGHATRTTFNHITLAFGHATRTTT